MTLLLTRKTLAAAAIGAVLALAGCSNDETSGMPGMSHGAATPATGGSASPSMTSGVATPAASGSSASASAAFNDADVTFARGMIPHHRQAVEMSDMILAKNDVDPQVRALAETIKAAQQPEIATMTGWLTSWGAPVTSSSGDHGGMHHGGGDGMLTPEEMQELAQANTAEAQRMFLESMIEHHQGAVAMAETEIAKGSNPDAIALAQRIVDEQQAEITVMKRLLPAL